MKQRILLVEDEDTLRSLLERYLQRIDFDVDAVGTAEAAWEMFSRDPSFYNLLIVDLTLPGMRGDELMRRALAAGPGIRVLLSSGLPYSLEDLDANDRRRTAFLQKPFLPKQLAALIAGLLDGAATAAS